MACTINPYSRKQHEIAKSGNLGLAYISWEDADENRSDWYGPVDKKTLAYVKRAQLHTMSKYLKNFHATQVLEPADD